MKPISRLLALATLALSLQATPQIEFRTPAPVIVSETIPGADYCKLKPGSCLPPPTPADCKHDPHYCR